MVNSTDFRLAWILVSNAQTLSKRKYKHNGCERGTVGDQTCITQTCESDHIYLDLLKDLLALLLISSRGRVLANIKCK